MTAAFVGIGSNLDGPVRRVHMAFEALDRVPGTKLVASSSLYRSAPLGPERQPDYINAVAGIETALAPRALLVALQSIEEAQGRVRDGRRWGPRTLDLDLLLYDELEIRDADLTVPHPQLAHRNFVLAPLLEVEPGIQIPGLGSAESLLRQVGLEQLERLPADG